MSFTYGNHRRPSTTASTRAPKATSTTGEDEQRKGSVGWRAMVMCRVSRHVYFVFHASDTAVFVSSARSSTTRASGYTARGKTGSHPCWELALIGPLTPTPQAYAAVRDPVMTSAPTPRESTEVRAFF